MPIAPDEREGWLLDLYTDRSAGVVIWFLADDGARLRLCQPFPVTFYAAGAPRRLRQLWRYLKEQPAPISLARDERRDLFVGQPIPVLAVRVAQASAQPDLFQQAAQRFPELTYYDADLPIALRYAAIHQVFPLARCRIRLSGENQLAEIHPLDTPWDLDPMRAPLRIMSLDPDVNPSHASPQRLSIYCDGRSYELSLQPERSLLINLRALLREHDPDLLLTNWGDTWLLPELLRMSRTWGLRIALNRDPAHGVARKGEKSYFSYGQVIHRGQQMHLFGRWHIDRCNAMLWGDYGLDGVLELSRVTRLPVQVCARVSPGTGISSMQIVTALRSGVLVPWHKQQAEEPRSASELFYADQGGLVYQPLLGLHRDVAEIDFISMYPSVMVHFNISPETIGAPRPGADDIPELGLAIDNEREGLVPETLRPLLNKRIAIKQQLLTLPAWDPRRKRYKVAASAHKWLLVTCFGYLGYKNARFGRIEAHQAVTAYGREALLLAKEAAEDLGFTVLHLYVDGLWVKRPGARTVQDFQPVIDQIGDRTHLPVSLDGVYRWVAFLPSRRDGRISVANRYFGVFQDGSLKTRGIEARRGDTPPFIAKVQMEILELLARAPDADALPDYLPAAIALLRRTLADLHTGRIPLADCLVTHKLSRKLEEFRSASPAARALQQLQSIGKTLRPGQRIRFLFLRGEPRVHAWDLPEHPSPAALDVERYTMLLFRAAGTVLQPFGLDDNAVRELVVGRAIPVTLPGMAIPRRLEEDVSNRWLVAEVH
ncbi:MAG: DNA polymerase domain-containing protein [Anaerolineaceae bacterium]|nr:DNA polymerase domain-containing protein [Anaerolineaceae bacterium]